METNVDYNLSIIMPFFRKKKEFRFSLPQNYPYFIQKGIEIIIVADEPLTINDFNFLSRYPELKYKIIVNKKPHEWRNPSKAINVGIRNASKEFILILSPESIFMDNIIEIFHNAYKPKTYLTGFVHFVLLDKYLDDPDSIDKTKSVNYGSIFLKTKDLVGVGGYNEIFTSWGCEDDEIRDRLTRNGFQKIIVTNARLVHIDLMPRINIKEKIKNDPKFLEQKKLIKTSANMLDFGKNGLDFNDVIIDRTSSVKK